MAASSADARGGADQRSPSNTQRLPSDQVARWFDAMRDVIAPQSQRGGVKFGVGRTRLEPADVRAHGRPDLSQANCHIRPRRPWPTDRQGLRLNKGSTRPAGLVRAQTATEPPKLGTTGTPRHWLCAGRARHGVARPRAGICSAFSSYTGGAAADGDRVNERPCGRRARRRPGPGAGKRAGAPPPRR